MPRVGNTNIPPYSAIGQLMMRFTDGNWYAGSGALINSTQVLTCGHNLIDPPNHHQVNAIRFYQGWNQQNRPVVAGPGQTPYVGARCAFYVPEYAQGHSEWDIGLINLAAPLPLPYYFVMQTVNDAHLVGRDLTITGYPGNHPGEMWTETDPVEGIALQYNTLSHLHDTWPGSSGSPVYEYDAVADTIRLYAVHVEGPNQLRRATLLTPAVRQRLDNAVYHPAHVGGFQLHQM